MDTLCVFIEPSLPTISYKNIGLLSRTTYFNVRIPTIFSAAKRAMHRALDPLTTPSAYCRPKRMMAGCIPLLENLSTFTLPTMNNAFSIENLVASYIFKVAND